MIADDLSKLESLKKERDAVIFAYDYQSPNTIEPAHLECNKNILC